MEFPGINTAVAENVTALLAKPLELYIGGRWTPAQSRQTLPVVNPSDGTLFADAAAGDAADIDLAVRAARRAFDGGAWAAVKPNERTRLLNALADAMAADGETLALLETLNTGKPLAVARAFDVNLAVECLRYNAGWATRLGGETLSMSQPGEWHAYTLREPVGVVGLITPWNVPLTIAVAKLAPALAAGCTVVLKPAELTPLTAVRLMQLVEQVGFPPGTVNLVTGLGTTAGAALVAHDGVDKISFTGSTAVGKAILAAAGGNMKRVGLELGGKSPVVVFPDADLDMATEAAARGIFSNTGQVCAAGSRLFVHRKVFDRIVDGVAERAGKLKVGPGLAPDTEIGPVISQTQRNRVMGYIDSGIADGARVAAGGGVIEGNGFFVQPTVFVEPASDARIVREEIFGPVLCAMPFDDDTIDAIAARANDTVYGLSASIWTRDLANAHRLARRIRAGSIKVNAPVALDQVLPFGGYKQSGWGRENGRAGVESYTEIKTIAVKLG